MLRPSSCIIKRTVRITLCLVQVISFFGLWFLYLSCGNVSLASSFCDCQVGHGQAASFPGRSVRPRGPGPQALGLGFLGPHPGLTPADRGCGSLRIRQWGPCPAFLSGTSPPRPRSLLPLMPTLRFEGGWAGSKALLAPALVPSGLSLHLGTSLLLSATWEGLC